MNRSQAKVLGWVGGGGAWEVLGRGWEGVSGGETKTNPQDRLPLNESVGRHTHTLCEAANWSWKWVWQSDRDGGGSSPLWEWRRACLTPRNMEELGVGWDWGVALFKVYCCTCQWQNNDISRNTHLQLLMGGRFFFFLFHFFFFFQDYKREEVGIGGRRR